MGERAGNTHLPYTEAKTKAWLSWLARGMQQHGQTVFMLEQLQPSWLQSTWERAAFTLGTRILVGLFYGLVLGGVSIWFQAAPIALAVHALFGFCVGLGAGLVDLRQGTVPQAATPGTPAPRLHLIYALVLAGVIFLTWFFGFLLLVAASPPNSDSDKKDELYGPLAVSFLTLLPLFILIWSMRRARQRPGSDIEPVETLSWSWSRAVRGWKLGCGSALLLSLLVFFVNTSFAGFLLFLTMVLALLYGFLAGWSAGVTEMKSSPNQGIRLSIRWAITGALIVSIVPALFVSLFSYLYHPSPPTVSAWTDVMPACWNGVAIGLAIACFAGSWFGGLDVLLHYLLRLFLYVRGRAPLNLVRFLDYAANELNFLQKVGGGYIFIHRMLLEHFASMPREELASGQPDEKALSQDMMERH